MGVRGGGLYGDTGLGRQPRAGEGSGCGMTRPTAKEIKAIADIAGVAVSNEVAERIANSIGPAFEGFAAVAGTLPFDLEPATFILVQQAVSTTHKKAAQ